MIVGSRLPSSQSFKRLPHAQKLFEDIPRRHPVYNLAIYREAQMSKGVVLFPCIRRPRSYMALSVVKVSKKLDRTHAAWYSGTDGRRKKVGNKKHSTATEIAGLGPRRGC